MDSDEAPPPPYSAVDPLVGENNGRNTNQASSTDPQRSSLQLRGGNAPLRDIFSRSGASSVSDEPMPDNFVSAAAYFTERPPSVHDERSILHHHLTIYPRSQSKDFPRRPRCWSSRREEIIQQDWDMFLRYLFPPHLGLAASSGHLPRQLRAQIQRDRKDRPQETDEQRKMRIAAVIEEWNQYFFEPRATRIVFVYVTDPKNAPSSPLCPKCYPAATQSTQETQQPQALEVAGGRQSTLPNLPPVPGQPVVPQASAGGYYPGTYAFPNTPAPPTPVLPVVPVTHTPYGPPAFYHHPNPSAPPPPAYPPHQPYPWGWNNAPYYQPQSTAPSKGGPLGWFSQLASQAQKYGERITEQAQQYGDQISAQAQYYGRQVEEQAVAHGRWIEQQAGFHGKKVEDPYAGVVNRPQGNWAVNDPRYQAYYANYYNYHYPNQNQNQNQNQQVSGVITAPTETNTATALTTTNNNNRSLITPPQNQRPRRSSVDSTSSESSLTSIDSISTTSDLSSSDLATVRAQLVSLNDRHDRELYEAAVGLRRQLDVLQESRRQARISGRGSSWGNGWGNYPQNHGYGRGSWGRWESPQQQQRSWAEKRAMKEEMRSTKKAFKDVIRRAREEQREQRRSRRARRRQERRSRQTQREETPQELPLEQRLENLELDRNGDNPSTVRSSASFPSTARSVSSSEVSDISSISTP
ncbi:hypothetical protein ASPWEDRAFT_80095, partial [Aspergillus wentii DTO 134E9]